MVLVKKSNEALFPNALIILTKTKDENRNEVYRVTRYWQEQHQTSVNWIQTEHMFDLLLGPYQDIFVFDKYAIVLKNESKIISTVYFDQFRYGGKKALPQYEKTLFNELEYSNHRFEKIAFWDQSGRGDYLMLGAIRSPGAITIHPFSFTIDTSIQEGVMDMDDSVETYLKSTAKISAFETTSNFLVVGCATCENNVGWLKFYNPRNTKLVKGIPGSAPEHMFLG